MSRIGHASVWQGYAAARNFLDAVVQTLPSYDLTSLWADMEIDAGESHDRALIDDWSEHWGGATLLTPDEALGVVARFIAFERGWSSDVRVHQLIEALQSGQRLGDLDLMDVWNTALSGVADTHDPRTDRIH